MGEITDREAVAFLDDRLAVMLAEAVTALQSAGVGKKRAKRLIAQWKAALKDTDSGE